MNHKGTTVIETERLILRPFEPEDAQPMFRNWASDSEVTKFLTWPTHTSVEVTKQVVGDWCARNTDVRKYLWAIEWKEIKEPIGSISAVEIEEKTETVTIGYCIGRRWWGKGIMPEALQAVIAFFFEEVGASRIEACHDTHNPNSGRVMRKCGMTYEGTCRAKGVNNQGICDTSWYSILKKEYEEARKQECVVKQIHDRETKQNIAGMILEALPEWFELPEGRKDYIEKSAGQLFFAAFREEIPVGFLCLRETGKDTAELAVMGVLKQYHRQGIGRALFEAARLCALQKGYSFLQVKTVQMGRYEDYDRTNRFYQSLGFKEFEVLSTLWDEANPCQIYVRKTEGADRGF